MCKRGERIVEEWNEKYPVGTIVRYWRGSREGFPNWIGRTSSSASLYSDSGLPVIHVEGSYHPLQLSHVEVVE